MCGFAGFLSFGPSGSSAAERRQLLVAMGDAIAHRGPDDAQYFDDGVLGLAFRRLSIIDVKGGHQPIHNEACNVVIAANAEIYNHHALRNELRARHVFSSQSDCEVPLHAYEEWGEAAVERLQGMFALAIWDQQARRLLLARDRLGIKPLYVCTLADGLLFGSELKALLAHPQCPRRLDWRALDRTAIFQSPKTSYVQGIDLLPAGETLTVSPDGALRQRRYWSVEDHVGAARFGTDTAAYTNEYADLLEQVTGEHLQREVGAGLHLSGGLDSSLIAAIVARKEKDFPCFTIVERTNYLGGDTDSARRLTQLLSLPWYPVHFDYRTAMEDIHFDLDRFEQCIWMMDSPRFDIEWLFKEELHRVAKANFPGLKVVLLGQGADEFAGGYSRRLDAMHLNWHQYLREEVVPNLVCDSALEQGGAKQLWPWMADGRAGHGGCVDPYHRLMSFFCRQLQHHNLWHEDRTSSWHGLEARVPFLDHRLVELLASVPAELHERLFWDKRIVRDAMHRFLPGHALTQPKIGFLDAKDTSSQDIIVHKLVEKIAWAFRDKYMSDPGSPFNREKIDALIRRVIQRGPTFRQDSRQLIECMAVSIFADQCQRGHGPAHRTPRPGQVLPVIKPPEWGQLEATMASPAICAVAWKSTDGVRLREGVEIVRSIRPGARERFLMIIGDAVAGQMETPGKHPWLGEFLKHIGSAGAAEFTVQDWIDELDASLKEFLHVLNILAQQGVVLRVDSGPAPTSKKVGSDIHGPARTTDLDPVAAASSQSMYA
jgi:asparagine synthase (glutamine-hydrolysing)